MNRKLFLLLTVSVFALLSSCGDSFVEVITNEEDLAYNPIRIKASLNVVVRNASSGALIGNASVKLTSSSEEKFTDASNGSVSFDSLYGGTNYTIIIEKDGYASVSDTTANINNEYSQNIYIAQEQTVNVTLYPKTASLSGILYYADINNANVSKPASGAQVLLQYNNINFLDRYEIATVDPNGKFAFNNLAAVGTEYTLTALEFKPEDGRTLAATNLSNPSLADNIPAHYSTIERLQYVSDVTPFILESHPNIIEPADAVVFKFSDNINLGRITDKLNAVTTNGGTATFEWGANSLTITPLNEWIGNFDVFFNTALYSVNGSELDLNGVTYSITVNNPADDISGAIISSFNAPVKNSNEVRLQWNTVPNATHYEVYYKTAAKNAEYLIIYNDDLTNYTFDFNNETAAVGTTHYFAVRALNAISETKFTLLTVTID